MEKVILSGMRPTGNLHLGNYFGALENWSKLQEEYKCFFFVADWHALTTGYSETEDIKKYEREAVIDFIASGIDPNKSNIFLQSDVKEHAELHLLFSMITPLSWLLRCPTYKDLISNMKDKDLATYGFLGYPCLQAADILMYKAYGVPVGEDQLPHLELTREIGRRFNHIYGKEVFPEPVGLLTESKVLPGLDGRKMSKSYNNTIALSDSPEVVSKKVMSMVTDPSRIKKTDPGHPNICSVFAYHKIFNKAETPEIEVACKAGEIGCVQCKRNLNCKMAETLTPIYDTRVELENRDGYINDVLEAGAKAASEKAKITMNEVREAMKI